jgi:hypothetical protein
MLICGAENREERRNQILSVFGFAHLSPIEIKMQLTETFLAMAVQKKQISIKDYFFMLGVTPTPATILQKTELVQPLLKEIPPEPIQRNAMYPAIKIKNPQKRIPKVILPTKPLALQSTTRNPLQYLYLNTIFVTISTLEKQQAPKEVFQDIGLGVYVVDNSPQQKHQQIMNTLKSQFPDCVIDEPIITQTLAKRLHIKTLEAILRMPSANIMGLSKNIPHLLQYDGQGYFLVALPEEEHIVLEQRAFQNTQRMEEKYYTKYFELLLKLRRKYDAGHHELDDAHIERLMYQAHTKNGQLRNNTNIYSSCRVKPAAGDVLNIF